MVALVTDAIYPYFRGGKELRYHEVARGSASGRTSMSSR